MRKECLPILAYISTNLPVFFPFFPLILPKLTFVSHSSNTDLLISSNLSLYVTLLSSETPTPPKSLSEEFHSDHNFLSWLICLTTPSLIALWCHELFLLYFTATKFFLLPAEKLMRQQLFPLARKTL